MVIVQFIIYLICGLVNGFCSLQIELRAQNRHSKNRIKSGFKKFNRKYSLRSWVSTANGSRLYAADIIIYRQKNQFVANWKGTNENNWKIGIACRVTFSQNRFLLFFDSHIIKCYPIYSVLHCLLIVSSFNFLYIFTKTSYLLWTEWKSYAIHWDWIQKMTQFSTWTFV